MMNNKDKVNGINIYHDQKGQTVYVPLFSKTGYIITKSDLKQYAIHSTRVYVAIIVLVMLISMHQYLLAIILAPLVYAVWEIIFRITFLKKLPKIHNFKKPKRDNLSNDTKQGNIYIYFVGLACSILFAIMVLINIKKNNFVGIILYSNYLLSLVGFGLGIYQIKNIISYYKK